MIAAEVDISETTPDAKSEYPFKDRETFWYMAKQWIFDVSQAIHWVQDGREPVELDRESATAAVKESEMNEEHIARVDPTRPGIVAHVRFRSPDGQVLKGHVLIDGHHRTAKCLREGHSILVYLLTEWESLHLLLRRPDDIWPEENEARHLYQEHLAACRSYKSTQLPALLAQDPSLVEPSLF